MKKVISLVSLLCIFLFVGVFLHIDNAHFNKRALARAEELNGVISGDKYYEDILIAKGQSYLKEQKQVLLNKKKNDIVKAKDQDKKPTYEVNPNDGTNFKEVFKNAVFIGDSISNALSYYKHLEAKNVVAKLGQNIRTTKKEIKNIKAKNPTHIYIMLGMNDSMFVKDAAKFKKSYKELVTELQKSLPNAKIYFQSILPADVNNKKAMARVSNDRIKSFNDALVELAGEMKLEFIDLRPFINSHPNFYEPDGIHLNKNFHRYWLKFIQVNYFN